MLSFLKKLFRNTSSEEDRQTEQDANSELQLLDNKTSHQVKFQEVLIEVLQEHGADSSQVPSLGTIDRIDWHEETVWERLTDEEAENMDDETHRNIQAYAGNHIGIFLAWLANKDLLGSEEVDYDQGGKKLLQSRQITGTDYLIDYCDTKFWSVDVATSLHPFIEEFYDAYMTLYIDFVPVDEEPYSRLFSWSDYEQLAPKIDELYTKYTISGTSTEA